MTPTIERAHAIIAGLERLRGMATKGPWIEQGDSIVIAPESLKVNDAGDIVCQSPDADCRDSAAHWTHNRFLIVTLVNGFEAVVETIKGLRDALIVYGFEGCHMSVEVEHLLMRQCDIWEPLLKLGEGKL